MFDLKSSRSALTLRLTLLALAMMLSGCSSGGTSPVYSPQLSIAPSPVPAFAATIMGLPSAPQTLTLTNTGTATLTVSAIAVSGDFAQSSGCASVAVNAGCQVVLTFTPTAVGARTGLLTVTSNASSTPVTLALSGTGTPAVPQLGLSASTVTFGTIDLGSSAAPWVVTATNTGNVPLILSSIAISGDFAQTGSGCGVSLNIGASCQIAVVFSPTAAGTRNGLLSVTSNAPIATQTIALIGTGATPAPYPGLPFQATVQAGIAPISGASVQFYAAGTRGNGSAPTALLAGALTTNASGIVTIPAGYVCPNAASPAYLVARGGTVAGSGSPNTNIALMTALGPCNAIASVAKYTVDEATTVAAVEALAQFYSVGGSIGATASNLTGIANAFATAATLADPVLGTAPVSTLPANAISPAPRTGSLANLMNACIVSASACNMLYTSTAQGTTLATNTLDAIYNLATHPSANVASLYSQSLAGTAYAPVLATVPIDWTMFVTYSGAGMNSPSGIGVDSKGFVWVSSYFYSASKFSPVGVPVFPSGITGSGLNNSYGLAIDLSDNVWIPNEQPFTSAGIGSVTELSSAGVSLAGNGYVNGGLNYPLAVAIDPNGTVWTVDYGNSHLTLLNSLGTPLSGASGYTTPLFAFPIAVAVDANHFGWIVNQASNFVTKVAPDGSSAVNYSCCNLASGIAIDQGDNIWVADYFGDSVSLLTNTGNVIATNYTAAGSIDHPQGIAIDGAGTVWVANYRAPYLSELSGSTSRVPGTSLSPPSGLGGDARLLDVYAIALDASGNVWVSNQGSNTITKFIGLVVPVKTPISSLPQLP